MDLELTDKQRDMILHSCRVPIVLAPLAGGPSTPELAAAVSEAGGLGFLATGYLTAADAAERIDRTRRLTGRPFGVNVFVPGSPAPASAVEQYARTLTGVAEQAGVSLGRPVFEDDDWDAKLAVLLAEPVPVVSFTFGLPDPGIVARLRGAGSEVWVTVGTAAEARTAAARGADVLVVQGAEAGGHRGGVDDEPGAAVGLLALLQIVAAQVDLPLVATGGIATGGGVAAALCAGASAAALGTAFLDSPEAATADVHRQALHAGGGTALTRAFTGRTARGIRNRMLEEYSAVAPRAYPEIHHLTAPLRQAGRAQGNVDVVNLWAGQAFPLSRRMPAGDLVRTLARETEEALRRAAAIASRTGPG